MIRRLYFLTLFLCVLCLNATAQQMGTWRMYLSYYIATQSVTNGSTIYSLMNGNLLSYDTEDGEVRTYDHLNELSDITIAYIAYSKEAGKLLIVYSNSNIDLLDGDGNIQNLAALKEKRILNKEVSSVYVNGSTAYIATGFGFVEIDMKEGVFRNTYKLSYTINSIAASDEAVFIATPEGIRYCMKTDNMHLEENWKMRLAWGDIKKMCFFQGKLIAANASGVFALDPNNGSKQPKIASGNFTFVKNLGNQMVWGNKTTVCFISDVSGEDDATLSAATTTIKVNNNWSDISYADGTYWMSAQEKGLCGYKSDGSALTATGAIIQPSSPIRDIGYDVNWIGDRLLVAGGINTVTGFTNPATAMYYEIESPTPGQNIVGKWTNFTEMEIPAEYPGFKLVNTTNLVQDPTDDTHHFASLYRGGLCEYKNGKFVKLYGHDNSPLHSILAELPRYYNYVPCSALSYDADGNLSSSPTAHGTILTTRN